MGPALWGRQRFAEWALEFADALIRKGKSRADERSRERLAHGTAQAEKLLKEGLVVAGLDKESLTALPANEPRKVELARLLWKRTTVSQAWIAERLGMRSAANVSLALYRTKQEAQGAVRRAIKICRCNQMHTDPQYPLTPSTRGTKPLA